MRTRKHAHGKAAESLEGETLRYRFWPHGGLKWSGAEAELHSAQPVVTRWTNKVILRKPILLALVAACLAAAVVSGSEPDTIPAGTSLDIRLKAKLSTKHNRSGDLFTAEIEHAVLSGNVEIVPAGSAVNGHIEKVQPAGQDHRARMRPVIDTIAGRSGMVYKLSPEIQRFTAVRSR